jgi:hypothetical protein
VSCPTIRVLPKCDCPADGFYEDSGSGDCNGCTSKLQLECYSSCSRCIGKNEN